MAAVNLQQTPRSITSLILPPARQCKPKNVVSQISPQIIFKDKVGTTTLKFTPVCGEGLKTVYSVKYAHKPIEDQIKPNVLALDDIMDTNFYFSIWRDDGNLGIMTSFNEQFICADIKLLERSGRTILFPLAHEIGHTWQKRWVDALCRETIEHGTGLSILRQHYLKHRWLEPVAEQFLALARGNSKIKERLAANFSQRDFPLPLGAAFLTNPFVGNELRQASNEAYLRLNAAAEVFAWSRAIGLVGKNILHPGMFREELREFIFASLETYNKCDNTTIYTEMFEQACRA